MFKEGDLVCELRHPEIRGYILSVIQGKMSKRPYVEIRWLNFPWGNPHTSTLELPEDIVLLSKGNKK